MSEALNRIYAACKPDEPATTQYYVDCGEARGETGLTTVFIRHLTLATKAGGNNYLRFLFSGHIGCGKSSELEHLSDALKRQGALHPRYLPILLNASDYLDDFDVSLTDILLAVVTEVAATLKAELGYDLKDSYFKTRFNEIKEFLLSDVDVSKAEYEMFGLKLEIQRLKRNPDARKKVRDRLREHTTRLHIEINRVFEEARLAVKRHTDSLGRTQFDDIVLIFDNLEKIRKFGDKEEGLASQRELFLESYTQLTGLEVHTIYTVPLRLVRSADGPQLAQRYGLEPLVLPMVKVFERGRRDKPYEQGIARIRGILEKRLGGLTIEEAFTTEALAFLLKYSGGHTRYLVSFVQNACAYADDVPLPLSAVQKAVQATARTFSAAVPEAHWQKLAQLELSHDQKIINDDLAYTTMLENLSVLEYLNGGDEDVFAEAEPWYAVNPIVCELKKFKEAVAFLQDANRITAKTEQEPIG